MKDNVLSSALLEVNLSKPDFDGFLTYDAPDDGNLSGTCVGSVDVFASGLRSAYDFTIHSNGNIYGTVRFLFALRKSHRSDLSVHLFSYAAHADCPRLTFTSFTSWCHP